MTQPLTKVRVFLVDDEPAVRRGLEVLLCREPNLEVCGQAGTAREALMQILLIKPDLAIIDLSLKEGNGLELVRDLRGFGPAPRILVFSMHTQPSHIRAAFRAGADGYVTKEEGAENLIKAIQTVMGGNSFLTEAIAARLGASLNELRPDLGQRPNHN